MDKENYLLLVNSQNPVPESFFRAVRLIPAVNSFGDTFRVEEQTFEAFQRLRQDILENDGLQIELIAAYRSIQRQEQIVASFTERYGREYAEKYVAKPGCSEHHMGLAIDVSILVDGYLERTGKNLFAYEEMYRLVHAKLPEYGFILRYPKPKEAVTEIGYEPWHFRYVGDPEIAREITDRGICLEEYTDL